MCTIFHLNHDGSNLIGKNQDMIYDGVYIFTNLRGIRKTALIMPPALPAVWTSKYGSLTISQTGKELPSGGMNEVGLVVEQATLWMTEYPAADDRSAINEVQWIQYMLDTCSTVQEVLQAAANFRIDQSTSKIHYFIADRNGERAIIEFLHGNMQVFHDSLSIPVLTNSLYQYATEQFERNVRQWPESDDYEQNSMERFTTVSAHLLQDIHHTDQTDKLDFAFETLKKARREDTIFTLVYDIEKLEIHASTKRNQERIVLPLADFSFINDSLPLAADLQTLHTSKVREQFVTYHYDFNLHAIRSFFNDPILTSVFQWNSSDEMIAFLARYPDSFE
ncbi:linear amide C-N hydrolase [Paenibacillus agilis]|uniref:Linear amide C-N hydrolase n=1 Tax=Paenibacillus agilis TaxID=3020863 RepID=A0A559IXS0_9BACL|nr:linear amide C-N hydrolase [Paenibacillus agilis]TVX92435.1 linear amide C-N hydrolase [Paenibacillus agilis]